MLRCLALCGLVLLSQSGARSPTAQTLSVPADSPRSELVALGLLTGATYFSNFEIRARPDAPWERHLPPMPAGTSDEVSHIARLRRAGTESGARRCPIAGCGGGAAGFCCAVSVSAGASPAGVVDHGLFRSGGSGSRG
jgi:hypothetical protein